MHKEITKPLGYRVMVRRAPPEEVTEGGIIIASAQTEREHAAETRGTVLAVGPRAWTDEGDEASRCEVGDKVILAVYSGTRLTADKYSDILVNDQDILAKVISDD